MKRSFVPLAAVTLVAGVVAVTLAVQSPAHSQMSQLRASPPMQTVGVAGGSPSGASTAWFHDASTNAVVACHSSVSGGTPTISCTRAALP